MFITAAFAKLRLACQGLSWLLSLAVLTLACPARADVFYMSDDGDRGITFTNLPNKDAVPIMADHRRSATASRAAPVPPRWPSNGAVPSARDRLAPLVAAAAATHGLPEELLTAVIEVESNFNPGVVSPKGAVGLMQLMPQTARYLEVADPHDPAANIDGGARYLKELMGRFGNNLQLVLAAYNAGPSAVQRVGAIPAFTETQRYVPRVLSRYHSLQSGLQTTR